MNVDASILQQTAQASIVLVQLVKVLGYSYTANRAERLLAVSGSQYQTLKFLVIDYTMLKLDLS